MRRCLATFIIYSLIYSFIYSFAPELIRTAWLLSFMGMAGTLLGARLPEVQQADGDTQQAAAPH